MTLLVLVLKRSLTGFSKTVIHFKLITAQIAQIIQPTEHVKYKAVFPFAVP